MHLASLRCGVLLAVLAVSSPGCAPERPANLLLVSVDTLRADALGAYGGPVPTPTLDGLAASGLLFEAAIASAPETAPSHASLFTGLPVQAHGVTQNGGSLPAGRRTLAESFREGGFATAAFVSSFVLDPRFGWSRGFEIYDARFPRSGETIHHRIGFAARHRLQGYDRRAAATRRAALAWLAEAPEPFFLFVHLFDPHAPYQAPPEWLGRVPVPWARRAAVRRAPGLRDQPGLRRLHPATLAEMLRHYQAEVLVVDEEIGSLLEALEDSGRRARTLVVVTADHGEGLGQHRMLDHSPNLYEEQIRVPLLMQGPGLAEGRRVDALVGLEDLAATLCELLGVPSRVAGQSFAGLLRGGASPRKAVIGRRRLYPEAYAGTRGVKHFVRDSRWKYIRASHEPDELYDLSADPRERRDLLEREPEQAARLAALLDEHLRRHPLREGAAELGEEERRGLEALGYGD